MLKMAFTAVLATSLFATGANAAPACGKRSDVLTQLFEKYNETPVGVGLASNGGLIALLTTDTGATWTLVIHRANGTTCLLATGHDWQPQKTAALDGPGI